MQPRFFIGKFSNIGMGMQDNMEHTTPTKDELKLIIDNSLLEQEKRLTKTLGEALQNQNKIYMENILKLSDRVTRIEARQDSFKSLVATASAASGVFSGLIGFFIAQLTK